MTTCCDTIDMPRAEGGCLDSDLAALFTEVEAILEAADRTARAEQTAPTLTKCASAERPGPGRFRGVRALAWQPPPRPIRAVQRSPPAEDDPHSTYRSAARMKGR
jgi:hypothetical protein